VTASRTRAVAVVVIVIAFVALAAFALLARSYQPGRDGVRVPSGSLGLTTPQFAQPISATAPLAGTVVAAVTAEAPKPTTSPAPTTMPAAPPSNNGSGVQLAACELGLPVPTEPAGLANLVSLVPAFGPFSPEAFAMVPAFEPAFPLFGPMIVAGGEQLDAHADAVNTAIGLVHPLEQSGYDALSPLYGPYRQQFLAAESQAASALRPGVAAFAAAPGATCVPALLSVVF
jgi:hypothetical protein